MLLLLEALLMKISKKWNRRLDQTISSKLSEEGNHITMKMEIKKKMMKKMRKIMKMMKEI